MYTQDATGTRLHILAKNLYVFPWLPSYFFPVLDCLTICSPFLGPYRNVFSVTKMVYHVFGDIWRLAFAIIAKWKTFFVQITFPTFWTIFYRKNVFVLENSKRIFLFQIPEAFIVFGHPLAPSTLLNIVLKSHFLQHWSASSKCMATSVWIAALPSLLSQT